MYGLVNKAIEDMVKTNHGNDMWEAIRTKSGVEEEFFLSNEPYDDNITFQLALAVSSELNMPLDEVLIAFGEWWVLHTTKQKYGGLMEAGGSNLKEFLINLPIFHNRVMLIYPKLTPPEFKVSDVTDNSLHLHYISKRVGLKEFVRGLISGLGKYFNTPVQIELLQDRDKGDQNEVYKISW